MVDSRMTSRWTYRAIFLGLMALIIFVKILPLQPGPGRFPGPDFLVIATFAWVIRRPDYVPALAVAAVFLAADLLMMRPPGLWTAITVLAVEYMRNRSVPLRDASFSVEWLTVGAVVTAMFLANALVQAIFVVDQPALGLTLIRLIATILAYPLVVALAARSFGLKKIAPGEVDQLGRRL